METLRGGFDVWRRRSGLRYEADIEKGPSCANASLGQHGRPDQMCHRCQACIPTSTQTEDLSGTPLICLKKP